MSTDLRGNRFTVADIPRLAEVIKELQATEAKGKWSAVPPLLEGITSESPSQSTPDRAAHKDLSNAPTMGSGRLLYLDSGSGHAILYDRASNRVVYRIHVSATMEPGDSNDNTSAPVVRWPTGSNLYFQNAAGSWNMDPQNHPMQGPAGIGGGAYDSPPYLAHEVPGKLVGVTVPENGVFIVVPYIEHGGWTNNYGRDLILRFFMNDWKGMYGDNLGFMDCDIVIEG